MLYVIFLYQHESGDLLFDKSFQEIDQQKLDLFSGFFQALKSFISEIVITGDRELRNIGLGEYTVMITVINEIKSDLIIIADKEDNKLVNKITPKMLRIILNHKELFLNWDGNRDTFNILDNQISEVVQSQSKLIGERTLLDKPVNILKSIWARKKDLSSEQQKILIQERERLFTEREELANIQIKLNLSKKILEISEELKDEEGYLKYQDEVKQLNKELNDGKLKLNYYLVRIKETMHKAVKELKDKPLRDGSYREVYLNLYSFSNKLKYLSSDNDWQEYKRIANMLIEKEGVSNSELAAGITKVLKMRENPEDYIN